MSQAQQGDHDAFSVLMTERIPRLYRIAGLITRRRDIAEDAVQDALMHAWRDLPRLRDVEGFDAWMHRLLVNACHHQGRRQRRQRAEKADQGPSWAADSSPFVFSDVTEAPREILVMRVDAEAPETMTDDPADDSAPNWGLAVDR